MAGRAKTMPLPGLGGSAVRRFNINYTKMLLQCLKAIYRFALQLSCGFVDALASTAILWMADVASTPSVLRDSLGRLGQLRISQQALFPSASETQAIRNTYDEHALRNTRSCHIAHSLGSREGMRMGTRASVEMYLCAFHLGKWEPDESVADAYHRALNIMPDPFHDMRKDDDAAIQEKHADAIHRMYEVAGLNLKTATEAEKASLRLRLVAEARKGGMRFPA